MFSTKFHAPGNPDFRQYGPIAPSISFMAATLGEVSEAAMLYRSYYDLGAGNWAPDPVKDDDGNTVGVIAYNGKIFADKTLDSPCIFNPHASAKSI